jgi:hypothetical protein
VDQKMLGGQQMTLFVNMNPAVISFLKLTAHKAGFPVEVISFYIVPHNPACSALAGRGTFRSRLVGDSVTPFREVLMMKKSDKKAKQVKKTTPALYHCCWHKASYNDLCCGGVCCS